MPAFWLFNLYIYRCVRTCVHVCIESSAAPGKGMPAKWQMVGINLAKSHSPCMSTPPHTAANFSTRLLSSQDLFCTLFAETNFSLPFKTLQRVSFRSSSNSKCPLYSSLCNVALSLHRHVTYDTAFLRGNTTVWKQTSSKNKMVCCLWRLRLKSVWSLSHNGHISCGQWEHPLLSNSN